MICVRGMQVWFLCYLMICILFACPFQKLSTSLNVSTVPHKISGNCSDEKAPSVSMTVSFNNTMDWILLFTTDGDQVKLDQVVRFHPGDLFNSDNLTSGVC